MRLSPSPLKMFLALFTGHDNSGQADGEEGGQERSFRTAEYSGQSTEEV